MVANRNLGKYNFFIAAMKKEDGKYTHTCDHRKTKRLDSQTHSIQPHHAIFLVGQTNPYTRSLLDVYALASKEPVYRVFRPSPILPTITTKEVTTQSHTIAIYSRLAIISNKQLFFHQIRPLNQLTFSIIFVGIEPLHHLWYLNTI